MTEFKPKRGEVYEVDSGPHTESARWLVIRDAAHEVALISEEGIVLTIEQFYTQYYDNKHWRVRDLDDYLYRPLRIS